MGYFQAIFVIYDFQVKLMKTQKFKHQTNKKTF